MGNQVFCSENKIRCTENCTRICVGEKKEPLFEEGQHCDPAGAVFDETLDELNDVDRQLLLFSSSPSLVAVRWVLAIGANRQACDSNSTSCLHAACRSGSMAVVDALARLAAEAGPGEENLLAAVDVAGWTPLHVAAFMGRREVVVRLLQVGAGAFLRQRTLAGQTPADLCSDARTRDVLLAASAKGSGNTDSSFSSGLAATSDSNALVPELLRERSDLRLADFVVGTLAVDAPVVTGTSSSREVRFEPFFVPRQPVIHDGRWAPGFTSQAAALGRAIFARQPGRGLSFLVASGCVRDYPIDLVNFLRNHKVDMRQIGVFLGEDFSLSKILRMEFLNAVGFASLGVVASLRVAFAHFRPPPDLQKLDRILGSLAEVWWRQNQRIAGVTACFPDLASEEEELRRAAEAFEQSSCSEPPEGDQDAVTAPRRRDREPAGLELRRLLPNPSVLHQLLFSAMMLHWNLHAPLPRSRRLDLGEWLELHQGICGAWGDVSETLLTTMYHAVQAVEIRHLRLGCAPQKSYADAVGDDGEAPAALTGASAVASAAKVEGWVRVVSCGLPAFLVGHCSSGQYFDGVSGSTDRLQPSSACMFSEATASSRRWHPDHGAGVAGAVAQAARPPRPLPPASPSSSRARAATSLACLPGSGRPSTSREGPSGTEDAVWLSLCCSLFFFSTSPAAGGTPFAFMQVRGAQLAGVESSRGVITIHGAAGPSPRDGQPRAAGAGAAAAAAGAPAGARGCPAPLQLVYLLPDGRWQSFEVPKLVIEVCNRDALEGWLHQLTDLRIVSSAGAPPKS